MKIALYGATGTIGQRILNEALHRGHHVTAIVRDPSKVKPQDRLTVVAGDLFDEESVATHTRNQDAVISAYGPPQDDLEALLRAVRSLIAHSQTERVLFVGGAATLEVAPGTILLDSPLLPEAWRGIAQAHAKALEVLKKEGARLQWTSLSPAALIEPGQRTGKFRLAKDTLLTDAQGNSRVSAEDYAVALIDELEAAAHIRQRFAVAY